MICLLFGKTYALLEEIEIILRQRVRLGHNGNKIDARAQALHDLNVKWLQARVQIPNEC
jgi:hypothetical protein